MVEATNKHSGL